MTHRDGFPRFSARSAWRGGAGHREPRGTPPESLPDVLQAFHDYVGERYNAKARFFTMNLPMLLDTLDQAGIEHPTVCASINKTGFRM